MTDNNYPSALPLPYRLHWYELDRVLGQGGFGITYLARDTNLARPVAIKEYFPVELAQRRADATLRERTDAQHYGSGLERFITEAQTLARFDHPNIVRVHAVFEFNRTAYMVMRFEEGRTLANLLDQRGKLTEDELLRILLPILEGLEQVHQSGFIHRDIKPENILIRMDGSPVLLDFGSARQSPGHIRGAMTVLVAPGYAPLEQYYGDPQAQGPWTDIYSLGATCYRAIAGEPPLDAIIRTKGVLGSPRDVLIPATVAGRRRYSDRLLHAVDHALGLHEKERPQSLAEWRQEIAGKAAPPSLQTASESPTRPSKSDGTQSRVGQSVAASLLPWAVAGLALLAMIVFMVFQQHAPPAQMANQPIPQVPKPAVSDSSTSPTPAPAQPTPTAQTSTGTTPAPSTPAPSISAAPTPAAPTPAARTPASPISAATSPVSRQPRTTAPPPAVIPVVDLRPTDLSQPTQASERATPAGSSERVVAPPADASLDTARIAIGNRDYKTGFAMLDPLAHAGNAQAQYLLGGLYADGKGVAQDNNQAYMWYGIAAKQGSTEAAAKKNEIARKLQAAEIQQGNRLIQNYGANPTAGSDAP